MPNFTVEEIRQLMDKPTNIRNISVIAHVDHGKSTLTDSLIGHAGIIAEARAGDTRFMDTRKDEQDRTITIKSTAVSLHFSMPKGQVMSPDAIKARAAEKKRIAAGGEEKKIDMSEMTPKQKKAYTHSSFLINLIDSPGHVDFSSEVTAALRVTDGALVVVDCVEGVCVQTETVLRQAIAERIKPILFVNKLDRIFLELHMDLDDAYQTFCRAVESVNVTIATYNDDLLGDVQVFPSEGTVGFGSGLHGWGFTVTRFANDYSKKFGTSKKTLMKKLWGNNFFDPKRGKWQKKQFKKDGTKLERGFCSFILKPIDTLIAAVMADKVPVYTKMLEKLGVAIPKDARELKQKPLLKRIMQTWLPAAEALLEMIVNHLPSPRTAQKYRVENLYSGPIDDDAAVAISKCDPTGPLMMYVSKMVPTSEKGRFYAFGRVFAGTIATGQTVRIMGPDFQFGKKKDLFIKKIQRTVLMMGRYVEQMPDCPCGNIIGLVGVDSYLLKSGTISTFDAAHPFHTMKYSVSPVVRMAVDCANASDLPKLIEGLKRLSKSDPLVQCFTAPSGEHIIAGAGELHLQVCIKDLREDFMRGAPVRVSEPVVSFSETVKAESSQQCISKSPNKHNRMYMTAEPLSDAVTKLIEDKGITLEMELKKRSRLLADEHKWDISEAQKIWAFGCPPDGVANCLVDMTKAVQYLREIKDSVIGAFSQATMNGVLCGEAMRGIRFNLEDVVMHADAIHRGAGQIMPPTRRCLYACQLRSEPTLLEPLYLCDITVPQQSVSGVYSTLNQRRGVVDMTVERPGTPLCQVKAFLPVLESFGFTQLLRQNTSGKAFPQMIFSHWQILNGEHNEEGSMLNNIILKTRERKGMKVVIPKVGDFHDRV